MRNDLVDFWDGATFMPLDHPVRTDILLAQVWKRRQATFLAFSLKVIAKEPKLYKETGFADRMADFKKLSHENRLQLIEYPPFMIWLKQSVRALSSRADLRRRLEELKRIMAAFEVRGQKANIIK